MPFRLPTLSVVGVCLLGFATTLFAQGAQPALPNSDPAYQQLRNLTLGSEAVSVNNLTLRRDAATFHLRSGTVCFTTPVQGKITGAVFVGDGNMTLEPPLPVERGMLHLLSKEDEFVENFGHMVLRFTDATYEELKKAGSASAANCDAGLLHDTQNALRHNRELKYNLDGRILQDVLSTEPGGLFVAFVHGKKYDDKEIFAIDPHASLLLLMQTAPEEVQFLTYDENKEGVWASFHLASEYKNHTASNDQKNGVLQIEKQQLDTTIEKNAMVTGKATTTIVSRVNGLRVAPFDLFRTLRVQSVTEESGQQLSFIQEDKNDDADFFVILPKPLAAGEKLTITTAYSGKDAVSNEGNGNYYPIARDNWYPNNPSSMFGDYTSYEMTFRIPKGMKITATGTLLKESNEGGQNVSTWKSEVPQTVAGFNFGRFKVEEAKLEKPPYLVLSYANEEPPNWVQSLQHTVNGDLPTQGSHISDMPAMGTMSTTPMLKKALADGAVSMQLYTEFFGPLPYKRLAMTQQTACNYGQSWPTLVWLPICSFFDGTVRHGLGIDWGDRGYWKSVAPHEVAHQWWGHEVGFSSYRDQWMSEGFADMSASLFIQLVEKNPKKFIEFWNDERIILTERNRMGFRAIDSGPVTMGYRMSNSRSGFNITRNLIYPKGAYILHMVRMMMWDRQTGDQNFKVTMQDFVKTYSGRSATTEDFKAVLEKHMTPEMRAVSSNLDWFFDEYVYGTALPTYHLDYGNFDTDSSGTIVMSFKVTQADVSENFRMLVPIYVELSDGRVILLGRLQMKGSTSSEQKIALSGLKEKPRRVIVNYYDDILASGS